jgi:hypothetical protein
LRKQPVHLLGIAQQSAIRNEQNPEKLMRPWLGDIARRLYARSGVRPSDVDLAAAVADLEADGTPRKEAIAAVARRHGLPKREVYSASVGRREHAGEEQQRP